MAQKFSEFKQSNYWLNKPVMKFTERHLTPSQRVSDEQMAKVGVVQEVLPEGYKWNVVYLDNNELKNVCDFLNIFKYNVSLDKLRWVMRTGFFVTINDQNNSIIATVGTTPKNMQLASHQYTVMEPLYMCCLDEYKQTGIPKVLMNELTRLSVLSNFNKGIFLNNRIVSKPIATIRQYARPINYIKLRQHNFIDIIERDENVVQTKLNIHLKPNKKYVYAEPTEENVNIVYDLYTTYMCSFNVHMILTKEEIKHYLFNADYVKTYLVYNDENKPIDFISYTFNDIATETTDTIKTASILMYSSNNIIAELLFINILKQLSFDGIDIVYINDMMNNNEFILSNVKGANDDTDDEEETSIYDLNIIKTNKKYFMTLYNLNSQTYTQNMVSWFIF